MKKILSLLFAVCTAATFTACSSVNSSDSGSLNVYPKTVGPVDNYRPIYSVDEKARVSGEAEVNVLFGIFTWGDADGYADNATFFEASGFFGTLMAIFPNSKAAASKAAFYKACKAGKCDAVVAARYDISAKDYFVFQKMKVKVSGFPAKVTSVETVKPMSYYVDASGKIVTMDKAVTPCCLFNLYTPAKKLGIF